MSNISRRAMLPFSATIAGAAIFLHGCQGESDSGGPSTPSNPQAPLAVGRRAPDFTLPATNGNSTSLSAELRRGNVVLAFFPRAFGPD